MAASVALDDLPDPVAVIDSDGRVSVANDAGWQVGLIPGTPLADAVHPADAEAVRTLVGVGLAGPVEVRLRRPDEGWVRHELVLRHLPGRCVVAAREVTGRTERERATEAAAAWLRAVVSTVSDLVFVCNPDGTVRWAGGGLTRVLGFDPLDLTGRRLVELVHAPDRPTLDEALATAADRPGGWAPVRVRLRRWAGPPVVVEAALVDLSSDRLVAGLVVTCRDVTGEWEHHQRAAALIDHTTIGVIVADPTGRVTQANEAAGALSGADHHRLVGRDLAELVGPGDRATLQTLVEVLRSGEAAARAEVSWRNVIDASTRVLMTMAAVRDTEGALSRLMVSLHPTVTPPRPGGPPVDGERGADRDPVTGLPGAEVLNRTLGALVSRAASRGVRVGIVACVPTGTVTDATVVTLADALRRTLRHGDALARPHGGPLVVLAADLVGTSDLETVAGRVAEVAAAALGPGAAAVGATFSDVSASPAVAVEVALAAAERARVTGVPVHLAG